MTSRCKVCYQEVTENDKTLVGKLFKLCSKCRAYWRSLYHKNIDYYIAYELDYKDVRKKIQQQPYYRAYQKLYRSLMKCPCKNMSHTHFNEDALIVSFN